MKLTLQLVVVVLNTTTKFRGNLFKFTLYTIIIYKVGDTRCHLRRHALIQQNFFHEIQTLTENIALSFVGERVIMSRFSVEPLLTQEKQWTRSRGGGLPYETDGDARRLA